MDDPDVDHELIALLRESLGFSNKAQDGVSSNTGKAHIYLLYIFPVSRSATLLHFHIRVPFYFGSKLRGVFELLLTPL